MRSFHLQEVNTATRHLSDRCRLLIASCDLYPLGREAQNDRVSWVPETQGEV